MIHDCSSCKKSGICDQETVIKHLTSIYSKDGMNGLVSAVMEKFSLKSEKQGEIAAMYVEGGCQVVGLEDLQAISSFVNGCRGLVHESEKKHLEYMLKNQAFMIAELIYQEAGSRIRDIIRAMSPALNVSFDVAIEEREIALPPVRRLH